MSEKLLLIDGHSILNRAYYGIQHLSNSKGVPTNAVYGFLNIMFKCLDEEKPTHITVAFDMSAPTFRHKQYAAYKGTRKPMDDELRVQVPMIQEMLEAMEIPVIRMEGYEADDILGTLSRIGEKNDMDVTILSGDRDLLQLATKRVKISIPKTKKTGTEIENYFADDVKAAYDVTPTEFIDVKALWGDTSDNIPGVPSIGEKTAKAIIAQYHSIEAAYADVDNIRPPRASQNLKEYYDQAVLSKELATIFLEVPLEWSKDAAINDNMLTPAAYRLCQEWELKNMLAKFDRADLKPEENDSHADSFRELTDFGEITEYFEGMKRRLTGTDKLIGLWLDTDRDDISKLHTVKGAALSTGDETVYIPAEGFVTADYLCGLLNDLLATGMTYAMRDAKEYTDLMEGLDETNLFDTAVADYLLRPLLGSYSSDIIAREYAGFMVTENSPYYEALVAYLSAPELKKRLEDKNMWRLYSDIELPLIFTLRHMETAGICMDGQALKEYGLMLQDNIVILEKEIYELAGEEFNINSPKQLGEILFGKLQIPGGKKTKTGYSTAADVLEALAPENPIIEKVLSYRQYAKLKSTYADGLGGWLADDGRVHCSFQQTVTATGRLSCTDPNLQNIPVRVELGRLIRKAFYPAEGCVFVDADYSQIELRVLAHMSQDDNLIQAFREDRDIHRSTAARVFKTPYEEVTSLQRRNAKAVNFGIVYGISAFGLAADIGVSRKEAQQYINDYFASYPKMKEFLDETVAFARENGYIATAYDRIRPIPELASSNFMQRQFGERVAMNSPIQGTAADIIKLAMVAVDKALRAEGLKARLLLQVHDELLIEAPVEEQKRVEEILSREMENAAELLVPLKIDMHSADNWYDAK